MLALLVFSLSVSPALADRASVQSQVLQYVGKAYGSVQDSEYISYDQALRNHMVNRIRQKFGVDLDPKRYSGFELLEIESFFECKKSDEPFELFLKMFPRSR